MRAPCQAVNHTASAGAIPCVGGGAGNTAEVVWLSKRYEKKLTVNILFELSHLD